MQAPPHGWVCGGTRPVLALHCSLAHGGVWRGLTQHLTGITVTAPDQIGHGKAYDWDGVSDLIGQATDEALSQLQVLGGGAPVDLFGHSFGGVVSLRIAAEHPQLVRSLTLFEPVLFAAARGTKTYDDFRAQHLQFSALVQAGHRVEAARVFHGFWGTGETLDSLPARTRDYIIDRIHLIVAQNPVLLDDAAQILRAGALEALTVPVLLVEGANSPPIIDAVMANLTDRLRFATRLSVAGSAHMAPITHAQDVAQAVQAQLDAS